MLLIWSHTFNEYPYKSNDFLSNNLKSISYLCYLLFALFCDCGLFIITKYTEEATLDLTRLRKHTKNDSAISRFF